MFITSSVPFRFTYKFYYNNTSLRPHQAEIEGDMEEYSINYIGDVKSENWPRRRGPYLQFLTYFVNFDTSVWMLLEQVDDCEEI
jgi:hypothetical protein